jgi:large subunit ribosomal protein L32e
MVDTKKAVETRNAIKKRNPTFVVKESHYQSRVKKRWRMPRGRHSGVRQFHKGKPAMPNPGYGSPVEARGLHKSGIQMVAVHTLVEMEQIDPATQGVIIGSNVGTRKKIMLLEKAEEKKITVIHRKDAATQLADIKSAFDERKKQKKSKLQEKSKKGEEKKKKAAEKAAKEKEEKSEGSASTESGKTESVEDKIEKEEKERKEAEKVITKKQ